MAKKFLRNYLFERKFLVKILNFTFEAKLRKIEKMQIFLKWM